MFREVLERLEVSTRIDEKKSAAELSTMVAKITDERILNKIEGVIGGPLLFKSLNKIFETKQFPSKTEQSIIHFFQGDDATIDEKLELIRALKSGMITEIKEELTSIKGIISKKYSSLAETSFFERFVNFLGDLKDSKDGQGSTGTGAGEVLLAMLAKDGKLPDSKGDVYMLGLNVEVKSSQGRLAAFESVDEKFTIDYLQKHQIQVPHGSNVSNLQELGAILIAENDKKKIESFLVDYYTRRAIGKQVESIVKTSVKKVMKDTWKKPIDFSRSIQIGFGTTAFDSYKKDHGFDTFLMFKESKNYLNTSIAIAHSSKKAINVMNFGMMGMKNGNQPVFSTVKVK